jgi:hypothetical protein
VIFNIIKALIQAQEKIPEKTLNVEGLLKSGTDAIALLGTTNFELNMQKTLNTSNMD